MTARSQATVSSGLQLVELMCSRAEPALSDPHKKFLELGCGTGNFLVAVFTRRLETIRASHHLNILCSELSPQAQAAILTALSNIYAVDIQSSFLQTARLRLRHTLGDFLSFARVDYRFWPTADLFLAHNLVVGDLLEVPSRIQFISWRRRGDFRFEPREVHLSTLMLRSANA